jgi:hypothetical protein
MPGLGLGVSWQIAAKKCKVCQNKEEAAIVNAHLMLVRTKVFRPIE